MSIGDGCIACRRARLFCGSEPKAHGARLPEAVHADMNVPFTGFGMFLVGFLTDLGEKAYFEFLMRGFLNARK